MISLTHHRNHWQLVQENLGLDVCCPYFKDLSVFKKLSSQWETMESGRKIPLGHRMEFLEILFLVFHPMLQRGKEDFQ